jgi:hypothetical protein
MSSVNATPWEKCGVDAATLAKKWGIGIEASKRMRLVITQRGGEADRVLIWNPSW